MSAGAVSMRHRLNRARRISLTFGRIYLGIKANQLVEQRLRPPDMRARWKRFNRQSAHSIYQTAIDLRGLILKGCQFMGSRADVLPREYVEVLAQLQDRVPPRPFPAVRAVVEQEMDRSLAGVFERFSERPIAAASLAQVHEARLRDGRRVAVKVQYPEIRELVRADLASLRALFRAVGYVERDLDLMPIVNELGRAIPLELDFVNEARNAERMAAAFKHRDDVRMPGIVWEHTRPRVLVMEFMEGRKITDLDGLRADGVDPDRVAQILVELFCEQILRHGFFHADPHPGNILVQPEGPRLVLLDFGLAKELPPHFRKGVLEFTFSLLRGDADGMAQALFDLGFETRDGRVESLAEIARFVLEVASRFQEAAHLDPEMVERVRDELPELVRANPIVRIPGHLVLVGRVLGLLSGVSRSLGSRVDLVRTILPYTVDAPA